MSEKPLWAGRFSKEPAPAAQALGWSFDVDAVLAPWDVRAGVAHVVALRDAGLLSNEEAERLTAALEETLAAIADGEVAFGARDEDIHSAIERGVTERTGELGAKLHAGRSRNDLVATDVRLFLLEMERDIDEEVRSLVRALLARARDHVGDPMPGTTHGRAAQPITVAHHLCADAWGLARDLGRLADWRIRASRSPLGAGALATSTLGLDPVATAERLGFDAPFENSLDAVSDRDALQEFLSVAAIIATHLSRVAADVARWTDPTLGWAELDEAYSTGSSMMPQKRNPDTLELVRAKAAIVTGALVALTGLLHGLPLGYQRDLQEDKRPLFDAVAALTVALPAMTGVIETLRIDTEAMRAACDDPGLYATDVAEALVRDGIPFREAHRRTGELLKRLDGEGRTLRDLTTEEWGALGVPNGAELLDPDHAIAARSMPGGPSPASVEAQLAALDALLAGS